MQNGAGTTLRLYNTLTRSKDVFQPIDPENVRLYVCGPTVYDYAHIGNARPVIVFDVLYRLLRHVYGADHVTYVRNITDVDDKINARALRDYPDLPLNEAIRRVTEKTAEQFHRDVAALGTLPPTVEPRATEFVLPRADGRADMVGLIQTLIDRGHAYESQGEILFDIASMPDYGRLSNRKLEDQQAGARVAVEANKKNPGDFVLWKESSENEPGWDATFRIEGREVVIRGRPGWHIECSAMSAAYLGDVFDIHGGGLDLIFPHHENEIAQSRCAHGTPAMANVWMHNGFLQVEGRKMAKSEGNFITIHDLLETENFGGPWSGIVLRLAMLLTHYRQPIDWTAARLQEARQLTNRWNLVVKLWLDEEWLEFQSRGFSNVRGTVPRSVVDGLCDDLNMQVAVQAIDELAERAFVDREARNDFVYTLYEFGFLTETSFKDDASLSAGPMLGDLPVPLNVVSKFGTAVANNSAVAVERYKEQIRTSGYEVKWIAPDQIDLTPLTPKVDLKSIIARRLAFIRDKNWAEADRIRAELLDQGIQLKDSKDPETGERVTTWEVKR